MNLTDKFSKLVRECHYWTSEDKVLIAVSGGVDSMVLLHLVTHLPNDIRPRFSVAYVDHQLRNTSIIERHAVNKIAENLGIPFYSYIWEKETHPQSGTEKAAREIRYHFFHKVMVEQNITKLLTGHHKNDQVETILMRIVRGSAINQLVGIHKKRLFKDKEIIRPLLRFTKSELYTYAKAYELDFYEDESNTSFQYTRNRYRNRILPLLKKENKEVEDHLTNFADDLQDLLTIASPIIEKQAVDCLTFQEDKVEISKQHFIKQSDSMQRLVLKYMLDRLYEKTPLQYKRVHLEILQEWISSDTANSKIELPGDYVGIKEYTKFLICKQNNIKINRLSEPLQLEIGKWAVLPDGKKIGLFYSNEMPDLKINFVTLFLGLDSITLPLTIRHRADGDRMEIKGINGTKKIQRIMIDQKLPPSKREEAILIEDARKQIIWLVGLKESALSTKPIPDKIQYVLILKE
ncbi:tRNA(Ile)-lysidine synthase [Marinilactibacillus piezotolerans]|uniref:tRNA(Ile)-lysidine synthase n=1 Tax=Marinilactibacillus piezotolerans TaxID=258723 RepID=A0A1I3Z6V9_9LACT|nr:tRNA lysidine(34) synthetase TilS [Marinilactibacillus piezotolerans]SFK39289.1 tRNA(Ile)-lysidine synthase [Marinilactibacillus piezotolerans]